MQILPRTRSTTCHCGGLYPSRGFLVCGCSDEPRCVSGVWGERSSPKGNRSSLKDAGRCYVCQSCSGKPVPAAVECHTMDSAVQPIPQPSNGPCSVCNVWKSWLANQTATALQNALQVFSSVAVAGTAHIRHSECIWQFEMTPVPSSEASRFADSGTNSPEMLLLFSSSVCFFLVFPNISAVL